MKNYFIELSAVHLALTLAYWLFMRNERQYSARRFYLVSAAIFALAVPLFRLPRLFDSEKNIEAIQPQAFVPGSVATAATDQQFIWSIDLLVYLYIAITVFLLYRFSANVFNLIRLRRKSICEKMGDMHVYNIQNSKASFSFFNWIFMSVDMTKDDQAYHTILV